MRYLFLIFSMLSLWSCKDSLESNCFDDGKAQKAYHEEKPFMVKEILADQPSHLKIDDLKNFRSFKEDSVAKTIHRDYDDQAVLKRMQDYKKEYQVFDTLFSSQFAFSNKQILGNVQYALGRNNLGFWLLSIKNNAPKAYFLGLNFSHYYINEIQDLQIIKNNELQLQGSLVKIAGLRGYGDYSALEDGKLFRMKLSDLEKDTDKDGYNDIFESCFGLDPNSSDSDNDGIADALDMNPLYKSESNKFSKLYEELLDNKNDKYKRIAKKLYYSFVIIDSDCDYVHQINPTERTLVFTSQNKENSHYLNVTNLFRVGFSKMKKDDANPNKFYLGQWYYSSHYEYVVEYKNGKWVFGEMSQTVS